MSGSGPDPITWLRGLAESATRIRLAPGVLGKTHTVMIGVIVIWAIVLFRLSGTEVYLDISLIGGAVVATLIATRWCRQSREFAVANPALALMEGADITEYQKFEAQMKGLTRGDTRLISDPIAPQTIPALPAAADPDA